MSMMPIGFNPMNPRSSLQSNGYLRQASSNNNYLVPIANRVTAPLFSSDPSPKGTMILPTSENPVTRSVSLFNQPATTPSVFSDILGKATSLIPYRTANQTSDSSSQNAQNANANTMYALLLSLLKNMFSNKLGA